MVSWSDSSVRHLDERLEVVDAARPCASTRSRSELARLSARGHLLRLVGVVPQVGGGCLLLQLGDPHAEGVEVGDAAHRVHRRAQFLDLLREVNSHEATAYGSRPMGPFAARTGRNDGTKAGQAGCPRRNRGTSSRHPSRKLPMQGCRMPLGSLPRSRGRARVVRQQRHEGRPARARRGRGASRRSSLAPPGSRDERRARRRSLGRRDGWPPPSTAPEDSRRSARRSPAARRRRAHGRDRLASRGSRTTQPTPRVGARRTQLSGIRTGKWCAIASRFWVRGGRAWAASTFESRPGQASPTR